MSRYSAASSNASIASRRLAEAPAGCIRAARSRLRSPPSTATRLDRAISPPSSSFRSAPPTQPWQQGRDTAAIAFVQLAVRLDERRLLDADGEQNPRGDDSCEEETPEGHHRRGPERDEKAEHQGVPHDAVERALGELRRRGPPT